MISDQRGTAAVPGWNGLRRCRRMGGFGEIGLMRGTVRAAGT